MQENENNNIMQDGEQRYVPKQYRDNKNPALEALVCFLIMIAFLAIQMIVMIPFIIAKIREQGADLDPGLSDMEPKSVMKKFKDKSGSDMVQKSILQGIQTCRS